MTLNKPVKKKSIKGSSRAEYQAIHGWFEQQVILSPNTIAIKYESESLTYKELNARANQLATKLISSGVKQNDPVGLCLDRSIELIIGIFGILKAGGAYVPLDPTYPQDRLAHILDQANPKLIVASVETFKTLPKFNAEIIDLKNTKDLSDQNHNLKHDGSQLCYIIFTSGTTGTPKGVMVSHQNVTRLFLTLAEEIDFQDKDIWTLFHSYAFGFSAWEIFGSLLNGSTLVIVPELLRTDPEGLYQLIRDEKITIFSQTPSAFRQLLLHEAFSESDSELNLRKIIFSGEAVVENDLAAWFLAHPKGPKLINTYAITETGGQVAINTYNPNNLETEKGNIGKPLSDTPIFILDKDLNPLENNEIGELCVGGPGLSRGYLNQPNLTAEKFITIKVDKDISRIYRTGDQAKRLDDETIVFLGRADGQIKLRGYRIELGDIETALRRNKEVKEVAVTLQDNGISEPKLVAYIVSRSNQSRNVSKLRQHVEKSLPDYMVPTLWVFLDALPLNANGKLDRKALPPPSKERPNLTTAFQEPKSSLEIMLAKIWSSIIDIDQVGLKDNFFELGGDSILALKLTSSLSKLIGEPVYIVNLIESPTLSGFTEALKKQYVDIERRLSQSEKSGISPGNQLPAVIPKHADRFETFPLTDIQQAYLVGRGNDFALGGVSTHLYIEVDAKDLDLERLEIAWQKVINRHPMLRAIIFEEGTQKILSEVPRYHFRVQDLKSKGNLIVEKELLKERDRLSHQVIPSDRWPLFEISASLMPESTRLHISLDCLITDARSFQIISNELLGFYHDENKKIPLPNLSFRDYVLAENEIHTTPFYKQATEYWKNRLKTLPPMPELPLATEPEDLKSNKFAQRVYELSKSDWEKFQIQASKVNITPTAALLQCFGEVLTVWSRNSHLTLNLTLFNRLPLHPDVDNVVGDFTSLLLLGVDKLNQGNFEERAQRLQKELWQGVDNRYFSGVEALRELAQMGNKVQPMMPIVFTSTLGIGSSGEDSSSWHHLGEQVYSVSQTPQVWLDHVVSERNGALWFTWDVIEELFPQGLIDEIFQSYIKWLTKLAREEDSWQYNWLKTQEEIFPDEQRKFRQEINATESPISDAFLQDGFITAAAKNPDVVAVISSEKEISYGELDILSNQLAHQLIQAGAQPNQLIAVIMQKGWEQIVAVLGILKAGAAYLPIDASMAKERLNYLLEFGEVKIAVTQGCHDATIIWPESLCRIKISDEDLVNQPTSQPKTKLTTSPKDIAYVIFTSGSTGQPKGVIIDHCGALNTCSDINHRFEVTEKDRLLAISSLSFDLSVYDIFGTLSAGGAIVLPDASGLRDPSHWATLVSKHNVSIWNSVPALMDLLTEYSEQQTNSYIKSLRLVMMSGDWIPVKLPSRIRKLCKKANINSLGGATEASIWSIIYPINDVPSEWTSIPYGKPMLNQTFHVLNSELQPCPNLVTGELYIGGIGLALGYWQDKEKTDESFILHPQFGRLYRTGDLGRYLVDGNIEFLGREDFQVKIQGFRVELGDIEASLEVHQDIRNVIVSASGPARGEKRLIAYIVPEKEKLPDKDSLRIWLSEKLPSYMVPSSFVFLTNLPLSANGKIDRSQLPEPASPDLSDQFRSDEEPSSITKEMTRLITEIIGIDHLDRNENLLQMGATSIEMIRIANALDQKISFRPRMDDFYREPSIFGLEKLMEKNQSTFPQVDDEDRIKDPLLTPNWVIAKIDKILDPEERNEFKNSRPGIRKFSEKIIRISLEKDGLPMEEYINHRSYREFSKSPVAKANLTKLLSKLRPVELKGKPKYLYASAGGLYPVQLYIYIKENRCENLDGGSYYFDQDANELVKLNPSKSEIRSLYDPIINRPIFDQAAFAFFLVVDLKAIASMYPERAIHYATLEAGHITQLLEMSSSNLGIGLCQIGGLETEKFAEILSLDKQHLLLHGLLGGLIDDLETDDKLTGGSIDRVEGEI
ncbi:MAG: amino acid adenylation domain-containing protein [Pseudomonadota bacterium]|nr:amino acid adenylation domain-containing protein [Pseudomonadota bacterium]